MDKFKNKYRIPSARLQSWDYGANGAYFITICTQRREHFFGEIMNVPIVGTSVITSLQTKQTMRLNELGQWAEKLWMEIPNHFPFIELGNFVVMPNHTHGILIIHRTNSGDATNPKTEFMKSLPPDHSSYLEQNKRETNGGITGNKNPMFHENISRVIRWYKGRCSYEMRKIHADFA
jgi:putative transposase